MKILLRICKSQHIQLVDELGTAMVWGLNVFYRLENILGYGIISGRLQNFSGYKETRQKIESYVIINSSKASQGILKSRFYCFLDFNFDFHMREVHYYDPLQ